MNTFPNWIPVNVVHRGHHFKWRCAGNRARTTHWAKWLRLSLSLAISCRLMPLKTLFCHLFCAAAVMYVMLKRSDTAQRHADQYRRGEDRPHGPHSETSSITFSKQPPCLNSPQQHCSVTEYMYSNNSHSTFCFFSIYNVKKDTCHSLNVNHSILQ